MTEHCRLLPFAVADERFLALRLGWLDHDRLGPDGLKEVTENAVLNANYLLAKIKDAYEVPYGDRCMHEFVASAKTLRKEKKVSAMEIAKRLLDFG